MPPATASVLGIALLLLLPAGAALDAAPVQVTATDAAHRLGTDDHAGLPGLGEIDGWVDADGDTMYGPLDMGDQRIQFNNGALTGDGSASGLRFAGQEVCLAGGNVPGCNGDITAVTAGTGLLGGGVSGDVALEVNTAVIQRRVSAVCAAGSSIRAVDDLGAVQCEEDTDTTYSASGPLSLAGTVFGLSSAGCSGGEVWKWNGLGWSCDPDADTRYAAGSGLRLDAVGNVFSADLAVVQQRIAATCLAGSSVRAIAADGSVTCEADDDTTYAAGAGLSLAGTTFAADPAYLQRRVAACVAGSSIRAIAQDGTVTCEADDNSGGTVTSVAAGAGLTGGPITANGTLSIATGGVTTAMLADDAVTSAKVAPGAIGAADLAADAVDSSKVLDGTLTMADLAFVPGDITGVTAGAGLTGGATGGVATLVLAAPTASALGGVRALTCGQAAVVTAITSAGDAACTVENTWRLDGAGTATVTTTAASLGSTGAGISAALGVDGLPVLSFTEGSAGDLLVLKCGNVLCNAGNNVTVVDSAGFIGWATSIAVGADGLPIIAYTDGSNADLKVAKCGNPACSSGNTLTTVDSTGSVGEYPSIGITPAGLPVIAYYHSGAGDLRMALCGNAACTSGNTLLTLDSAGNVGRAPSLGIHVQGFPIVSYFDLTNDDLKVLACRNAACTVTNVATVDGPQSVGSYSSLAIGADGRPLIAYYDGTSGDLKLVRCGSVLCLDNYIDLISIVDNAGFGLTGWFPSLAIGPDGMPVMAYYDVTNGDLMFARCGDGVCDNGEDATVRVVLESAGNVGHYATLIIGADGLPFVAYQQVDSADLKVAHLPNRFGISRWWHR